MDPGLAKKLLDELLPQFEILDTQCAAVVEALKAKGMLTDEELAAHLEQAGKASNVRWRATRLRIEYLLNAMFKETEKPMDAAPQPAKNEGQEIREKKIEEPKELPETPEKRAAAQSPQSETQSQSEAAGKQAETEQVSSDKDSAAKNEPEGDQTTDKPEKKAA